MSTDSKRIFLTWIAHRRTHGLCDPLELQLEELTTPKRGLQRYLLLIPRTVRLLVARRPTLLVVQSPSIVLSALAFMARPLLRYRLVIDAHNEAVDPYIHPSALMKSITRFLIRHADHVLVTNKAMAASVSKKGGRPIVLPDPLPSPPRPPDHAKESKSFEIAVICTYASDEPVEAIISAAAGLNPRCTFFITGNADRLEPALRRNLPPNVNLTGFLSEHDYWALLIGSDAIMDLTLMDNCLVCGAYEGIAAGRPIVLSDNAASRELFAGFGEFTTNDAAGISAAIERLMRSYDEVLQNLPSAIQAFQVRWEEARNNALAQFRS